MDWTPRLSRALNGAAGAEEVPEKSRFQQHGAPRGPVLEVVSQLHLQEKGSNELSGRALGGVGGVHVLIYRQLDISIEPDLVDPDFDSRGDEKPRIPRVDGVRVLSDVICSGTSAPRGPDGVSARLVHSRTQRAIGPLHTGNPSRATSPWATSVRCG